MKHQIEEMKLKIDKTFFLLEFNEEVNDLLEILINKYQKINNDYNILETKSELDERWYYALLSDFYDNDLGFILKLISDQEENNSSNIYDDSNSEINEKLLQKQQEIIKCIDETGELYQDEVLTNYIKDKYEKIINQYQENLDDYLKYRKQQVKNYLLNTNENVPNLAIYPDINHIKNRCIIDLTITLDDFIKYVNALIENTKLIEEIEQKLTNHLEVINNSDLQKEFQALKEQFQNNSKNMSNLGSEFNNIQKKYYEELKILQEKIYKYEEKLKEQQICNKYIDYLSNTNPLIIKFSMLDKIKEYLNETNDNTLRQKLYETYYNIIKYEVRFNYGKSVFYNNLEENIKFQIERLYLEDLKRNKYIFKELSNQSLLKENFSLELLKKFTDLTIDENLEDLVDNLDIQEDEVFDNEREDEEQQAIPFRIFAEDGIFDDNDEALIKAEDNYFVVNKNGEVKKVLESFNVKSQKCWEHVKYHDGIITYKFPHTIPSEFDDGSFIIQDIDGNLIHNRYLKNTYEKVHFGKYQEGLIYLKYDNSPYIYYIDKYGRSVLEIKGKDMIPGNFSCGVAVINNSKKGKIKAINKQGRKLFSVSREVVSRVTKFENGIAVVFRNDGTSCYINTRGNRIFSQYRPSNDEYEMYFSHGIAKVQSVVDKTYAYIDTTGKFFNKERAKEIFRESRVSNYSLYFKNGKYHFIKNDKQIERKTNSLYEFFKKKITDLKEREQNELYLLTKHAFSIAQGFRSINDDEKSTEKFTHYNYGVLPYRDELEVNKLKKIKNKK